MYYGERMIYAVFHHWKMLLYYALPIIYTRIHLVYQEDIVNDVIKIASCFKQRNSDVNVFICGILPRNDISSINRRFIKETNNILKSSCSVNHINFIGQDAKWIQMSGSLKPDLCYSHQLHLVENGNLILAKSVYIPVKNHYRSRSNYQLNNTYKSVTADFPTLTPLSPCKPVSDYISVSPYKSVHKCFIKPVQKPSYISSIITVPVVVCKCSFILLLVLGMIVSMFL